MIVVVGEVRFGAGEIARLKDGFASAIKATRAEDGFDHYKSHRFFCCIFNCRCRYYHMGCYRANISLLRYLAIGD